MSDAPEQLPMQIAVNLPPEQETGVFADLCSIWHTPSTFVLDFLTVKQPPVQLMGDDGQATGATLDVRVAARVRIPPEQIFGLINALQNQANQWLEETGRSEPPEAWAPHQQ